MFPNRFLATDVLTDILNFREASLQKKLILPDLKTDYHLWRGETVIVLGHAEYPVTIKITTTLLCFITLFFTFLGSEKEHRLLAKK